MDFNEYQTKTQNTAIYPGQNTVIGLNYSVVAMVGEAGEVANRFKKVLRDDKGRITPEARADLLEESGDVLWYLARICHELDSTLEFVAQYNISKLEERHRKQISNIARGWQAT